MIDDCTPKSIFQELSLNAFSFLGRGNVKSQNQNNFLKVVVVERRVPQIVLYEAGNRQN